MPGRFSAILYKRVNFYDLFCSPTHQAHSERGFTDTKRKEFAPIGSKFFPFRVDPVSEGRQKQFDRPPLKVYLVHLRSIP